MKYFQIIYLGLLCRHKFPSTLSMIKRTGEDLTMTKLVMEKYPSCLSLAQTPISSLVWRTTIRNRPTSLQFMLTVSSPSQILARSLRRTGFKSRDMEVHFHCILPLHWSMDTVWNSYFYSQFIWRSHIRIKIYFPVLTRDWDTFLWIFQLHFVTRS